MFNDGINNDFEKAHDRGLRRGFDLGWSYKGRFDRQIIKNIIEKLEEKVEEANTKRHRLNLKMQIFSLNQALKELRNHPDNREDITFW